MSNEDGGSTGGAGLGDFVQAIRELSIDWSVIGRIEGVLADCEEHMRFARDFTSVPAGSLGTLPAGSEMTFHTGGAHQFLLDSLLEMTRLLGQYDEGVAMFKRGSQTADEYSTEQMRAIEQTVASARRTNNQPTSGSMNAGQQSPGQQPTASDAGDEGA